ncbi:MAG: hypothetical protein LC659_05185 [Myxococcales bacterium]|nr:hypothetical protein [Myxococcales bacterium]
MTLFPFEERWAATIGRALVPVGALGGALDAIDLGARYGHECACSPWYAALAFRASLWLTWLAPLWMQARLHTFGGVDEAARVAILERLLKHRVYFVRMAALFLKLAICTLLLGDVPTLTQIGAYRLRKPA